MLKLGNLIGAVFYIDQKEQFNEVLMSLRKLADILKSISKEDFQIFKTWLKNIIVYALPKEQAEELENVIDKSEEVEEMEYALGLSIYNKLKEAEQKGEQKGRLEGKLDVAKKLLAAGMPIEQVGMFTELSVEEIQKLIDKN